MTISFQFNNKNFSYLLLQIFYVIDTLYDISCRIQHIPSCHDIRKYSNIIKFYFENFGGLVMMGGDLDSSSKCIAGLHIQDNDAYLLVVVSVNRFVFDDLFVEFCFFYSVFDFVHKNKKFFVEHKTHTHNIKSQAKKMVALN